MYITSLLLVTILIPCAQSVKATLKLTFSPDERYYAIDQPVDISCDILNPNDASDSAQLWHVDLQTGKYTPVSRSLINSPADDAPNLFKKNKLKRVEFMRKNQIRILRLAVEDSAQYECNCPDCEVPLAKDARNLQVMKLVEPRWKIEPSWQLQENAKTTIQCIAEDFYPYVGYKVFRSHHEIGAAGKANLPNSNVYPQKFTWEDTVTASADWHNHTLRCTVIQGNSEQHAIRHLDVLFSPRFGKCDEKQYVNSTKETASIECSFAGNPPPKVTWIRLTDNRTLAPDTGITIETKDEQHGRYKSVVTFERDKLVTIPPLTTTKSPNGQPEPANAPKLFDGNYYQQLLNSGFIVKLLSGNNDEKGLHRISIVGDAKQAQAAPRDASSSATAGDYLSTSIRLLSLLSLLLFVEHP